MVSKADSKNVSAKGITEKPEYKNNFKTVYKKYDLAKKSSQ